MEPTSRRGRRGGRRRRDRRARRGDGDATATDGLDRPGTDGPGTDGPGTGAIGAVDAVGSVEGTEAVAGTDGGGDVAEEADATDPAPAATARTPADPGADAAVDRGPDAGLAGFQLLLDANPLGALLVDDDRVVLHNDRAATLLGTHHDDLVNGRFGHPVTDAPTEVSRLDPHGRARTLTLTSTRFPTLGTGAWLVTIADATDRPADADADEHFGASTHDPLTGLPTRELLLNHLYDLARRSPSLDEDRFAVVVIDLERFVQVNEVHGHEAGDRVLQTVAARLTSVVRPGDYVSRSGGDEFAIVLGAQPLSAHLGITDRVEEVLSRPIVVDGAEIYCTPVIGIAEHVDTDDEHELLARAEAAMVTSDAGTTHLAARPTERTVDRAAPIGLHSTGAIEEGQVFLHYQPIFTMASHELIALEALARWEHPDDGLVVPDELTRIATEDGAVRSIGEWVIAEVCEQIATWRVDHPDYVVPTVHINVSARQAGSTGLRRDIADGLARHGLDPSAVRFEITEDVLVDRDPRVEALLRDVAEDGVELILDGFGTGVSSLTHLRRFPLAGLKVDRSFVTRLMTDEPSAQLVLAAIDTGRAFHLPVTAVGIEDAEQKAVLARWGCDLAQGYLLARPVTAVEAPRFFERDPSTLAMRPRGPLLRSSGTFVTPTP